MATSITTTYAGEFKEKYIAAALLSGKTLDNGGVTVLPNIAYKEVIQKSVQAQGANPEIKSKETPKPVQIPAGIAIKDAGGKEYFYNGKQWTNSSGVPLSTEEQQKYSKMYAMDPKTFYKSELAPDTKAEPVKESKTQSAIRAEKIPSLKTR